MFRSATSGSFASGKTFGIDGVPIGFSLKKVFYDVLLSLRMMALLRANRYDLIHAVEESAFIAIAGKILFKTPYVFDMGTPPSPTRSWKSIPTCALRTAFSDGSNGS